MPPVPLDLGQTFTRVLALVVACHVGVQLSPNTALNLIVIGAIRRKKVKHNPAVESLGRFPYSNSTCTHVQATQILVEKLESLLSDISEVFRDV